MGYGHVTVNSLTVSCLNFSLKDVRNSDTPFLITDCSVAPVNEVCLLANCSAPQLFGPDGENGAGGQHLPLAVHGVQDLCGVHGPL